MSEFNFNLIREKANKAIQDDMLNKAKNMFPNINNIEVIFNPEESKFIFKGLTHEQVEQLVRS